MLAYKDVLLSPAAREADGDVYMVAVLRPTLACALIIALGSAFGSF